MKNKDNFPTIEQSLKMIQEKLKSEKKRNKIDQSINKEKKKPLSSLFKKNNINFRKTNYKKNFLSYFFT